MSRWRGPQRQLPGVSPRLLKPGHLAIWSPGSLVPHLATCHLGHLATRPPGPSPLLAAPSRAPLARPGLAPPTSETRVPLQPSCFSSPGCTCSTITTTTTWWSSLPSWSSATTLVTTEANVHCWRLDQRIIQPLVQTDVNLFSSEIITNIFPTSPHNS